jgi:hypothetical protein
MQVAELTYFGLSLNQASSAPTNDVNSTSGETTTSGRRTPHPVDITMASSGAKAGEASPADASSGKPGKKEKGTTIKLKKPPPKIKNAGNWMKAEVVTNGGYLLEAVGPWCGRNYTLQA